VAVQVYSDPILVTGGLGYIGSHTCVALAKAGYRLIVVDNLCNSKPSVLGRIRELAPGSEIEFREADLRDRAALATVFAAQPIDAVVHFAGLKAVGESVEKPLTYWDNNVGGTIALLEAMQRHGVHRIVFSSSATVYGPPEYLPYREEHPLRPESPYGRTKLAIEQLLSDQSGSEPDFLHASLRYFNPIGAHPSGRIGEDPRGIPNNLLPYITQVAIGRLSKLRIFGNDYPTPDGTGVRDYIHVMDLAEGHVAALRYLRERGKSLTVNLCTGSGRSVLQMVSDFAHATGIAVPYECVPRRPGDIAAFWADPSLAARELGWRAALGHDDMCRDAWRWQTQNPEGYP
jgi:UDP-glucose 4-epimerase